jgi:hypothetical protein
VNNRHFTAWLVNDPGSLDQGNCDVTIQEDECLGDPDDPNTWVTDTTKDQAFYAVTSVDAKNGEAGEACREAETLMGAAGWRKVGDWEGVPNAYIVTVTRI